MNQKIKDEAREKIARELSFFDASNQWDSLPEKQVGELSRFAYRCRAAQILSLSGETDEVCVSIPFRGLSPFLQ